MARKYKKSVWGIYPTRLSLETCDRPGSREVAS